MSNPTPHRVILAVINDLSGDQRLHRISSTLAEAGFSVTLVGRQLPDSRPLSPRSYQTRRFRLPVHRGMWFYLLYNLRLFIWLLAQKVDTITANDLDTLLACYWAARIRRKRLIYDAHELFTEVPELIHRPTTRRVWLFLEKWLLPKITTAYTVNESLARIYREAYQVPFVAVRNVPFAKQRPKKQTPANIILYQGALNLGRGIDLMLDAMAHLPEYELWVVGKGDVESQLREQAAALAQAKVRFWGFVPLEELAEITAKAGLGLSLEEDLGANYHFASPNKVYDYLQAGIPVLVADLPEMTALVREFDCGEILPDAERTPELLAGRIRALFEIEGRWQTYAANASLAANQLVWENEKQKLLKLYQEE